MTDPDPLLVRPFLVAGDDDRDPEPGTRWPASEYRTIRSHRRVPAAPAPAQPAPAQPAPAPKAPQSAGTKKAPQRVGRKKATAVASAGAVAVIGLAAAGYGMLRPDSQRDGVPIPSGALPPIAAPSHPSAGASTKADAMPAATSRRPAKRGAPSATTTPVPVRPSSAAPATTSAAPPAATSEAPPAAMIAPPEAARVGTITADSGLCLDLNGGVPADDNHVQVYDCNNTPAQRWTLAPDGTLQVVGKCAEVTDENTVHIAGCDSDDEAQWRAGPDDTLVNLATDACLTGSDTPSTAVTVSECSKDDDQEWTIPN